MTAGRPSPGPGFRHEAFLYAGADDFVDRSAPIVLRALAAEDPVLVAIDSAKIELLRDRLGSASRAVVWKDIRGIGANPARIIPIWREFVERAMGCMLAPGFRRAEMAGSGPRRARG